MSKRRSRLINYHTVKYRTVAGFTTEIHFGKQAKHLEGAREQIVGRSPITVGIVRIQDLVAKFAGTGRWLGKNKERVDFREIIGKYIDPQNGNAVETTWGTIHYSKTGAHVVPARRKDKDNDLS